MLPVRHNPKNGFTVVRCHYSIDPEKNTPEWIAIAKKGMTERGWSREYEIDYTFFAGKPFFPEFKEYNIAPKQIGYAPGETLYRGWDFGFHRPCVVITRINQYDQWCLVKVILGKDEGIRQFGNRVRTYCLANFPGATYIDAADVAGTQVTDKNEATSVQILNALGIYPQTRKQPKMQGAEIIRQKMLMRVDGKTGFIVSPTEQYAIDAFRGGLHYPTPREGTQEFKEEYEKDGYYDHFGDSLRYIATEVFSIIGETQMPNQLGAYPADPRNMMGFGSTGRSQSAGQHGLSFQGEQNFDESGTGMEDFFE